MNEESDPHPADEILGADWKQPMRVLTEKYWDAHPERERNAELQRERDEHGERTWQLGYEYDPPLEGEPEDAGWTVLILRPVDPTDTREPVRVGRWPTKFADGQLKDAQAIVDEHRAD